MTEMKDMAVTIVTVTGRRVNVEASTVAHWIKSDVLVWCDNCQGYHFDGQSVFASSAVAALLDAIVPTIVH